MTVTSAVLRELVRAGLNADQLVEAVERIEEAERPRSSTERVRAFRERQQDETGNVKRVSVSPTPDKERFQTSKEINPSNNPPSPPTGAQTPAGKNRGSRIPDDFVPDLEVATGLGLSAARARLEADKFIDWFRSAPGQKGVKLDWPATWRNWIRRELDDPRRSGPGPPNGHGKPTFSDIRRAAEQRLAQGDESDTDLLLTARTPS